MKNLLGFLGMFLASAAFSGTYCFDNLARTNDNFDEGYVAKSKWPKYPNIVIPLNREVASTLERLTNENASVCVEGSSSSFRRPGFTSTMANFVFAYEAHRK